MVNKNQYNDNLAKKLRCKLISLNRAEQNLDPRTVRFALL